MLTAITILMIIKYTHAAKRLRLAPKKKYSANFLREVNHKYLQHKTKIINIVFGRKCNFPSLRGDIDNRYCQDPLNYIFFH